MRPAAWSKDHPTSAFFMCLHFRSKNRLTWWLALVSAQWIFDVIIYVTVARIHNDVSWLPLPSDWELGFFQNRPVKMVMTGGGWWWLAVFYPQCVYIYIYMRVSINGGTSKWMVFVREKPSLKWMMTGGTPIYGNIHIYIHIYIYTHRMKQTWIVQAFINWISMKHIHPHHTLQVR